jgi:MFS family permease
MVLLMATVPPTQRSTANALYVLALSMSGLVGPLLGGIFLGVFGVVPLFLLKSLSLVAVVIALLAMPAREREAR